MPSLLRTPKSMRPLVLAALVIALFFIAGYFPGAMSLDSAVIWSQARGAPSTNIYGAGLRWLWWLTDKIWPGPGPLFLIQLALLWSGLVLIAQALASGLGARLAFLLVCACAPVLFVLLAHVWSDVMLLATLAFAVGALLHWRDTRRTGWFIAFWLALAFAATLRHNVLPATLPLIAYALWLHFDARRAPLRHKSAALILGTVVLGLGLHALGTLSAQSAQRRFPLWPATAMWDLAALSLDADHILLPAATHKPELTLADLSSAYVAYANVPIFTATQGRVIGPFFLDGDPALEPLQHAWLDAIAQDPRGWLAHRWRLTCALFGTKPRAWPHELIYVDEEVAFRDNPSVTPNRSALHTGYLRIAEGLRDTVALAAWPYLAVSLVAFYAAWRRRESRNAQAALVVLASGLAYAAPLPLIAPSAELRYLGWTCLAALIGTALAIAAPVDAGTQRSNW